MIKKIKVNRELVLIGLAFIAFSAFQFSMAFSKIDAVDQTILVAIDEYEQVKKTSEDELDLKIAASIVDRLIEHRSIRVKFFTWMTLIPFLIGMIVLFMAFLRQSSEVSTKALSENH